jgi:ketosteroid isomerase-like protein
MSDHPPCLLEQINKSILVFPMTPTETVRDLYRAMREKDDAAVYELCSADIRVWRSLDNIPEPLQPQANP